MVSITIVVVGIAMISMAFVQIPMVLNYFYYGFIDNIKLSFYMAFKYFITTLIEVIVMAASVILLINALFLYHLLPLWLFFGISVPLYIDYIISQRFYRLLKENKLAELSMDFSIDIINLVRQLKESRETIISNQIGRSGTSIGANIREAQYAHGKADFIAKLQIALKEANETGYWLELLYKTNYITESEYKALDSACTSIRVMLISSINTAKERQ